MSIKHGDRQLTSSIIGLTLRYLSAQGQTSLSVLHEDLLGRLTNDQLRTLQNRGGISEYRRIINYLKHRQYIKKDGLGENAAVTITHKGALRLQKLQLQNLFLSPNGKWDEKWRIVTFDIPEEKRVARNALRRLLKQLGFRQLHSSVWIHPLPCVKEIGVIKDRYGVHKYVTLMEVAAFDREAKYRWMFRDTIK